MFGAWTFGRKLGAGFVFACLALIAVGVVGYESTRRLIANDDLVTHTQKVRREIAELLATVVDAETGQRGFVITGDDAFLEPYRAAVAHVDQVFEDLRRLTVDNTDQQHHLDTLRPLVDSKLAELKEVIDARHAGGFDAAEKLIASQVGKQAMDQARAEIAAMDGEEERLLASRADSAQSSADTTKAIIVWGSVAALLLVSLFGWLITRSTTAQVGAAVRHMQSSSSELQAAATQQATGAREQSSAMGEIATTISELAATSRQIAESAQRVASIAEQTATSARTGDATVGRGNETIQSIRRQVDLVVTSMLELGKKSQQVGAVLDIVAELAEQTNILAINATIEAAGAGESGRRFAVVADEIRKLADRVAGSTKEIRGLVDDVRSAVNTTVMTTETSSKAVDAGSRQFSEVATAFEQIVGRVATATDAAKEIELSTKQQASAVEQVTLAITSVAQATRESEASTGQTLQTASELATLSRDLLKLVQPQVRA